MKWGRSAVTALTTTAVLLSACGFFNSSGTTVYNDAVPDGTILATGTFEGRNNQTVTGTATIYLSSSSYILRLSSLSAPSESNLSVYVTSNGTDIYNSSLRGSSGNQNYTMNISATSVFSEVSIRQTTLPTGENEYGNALMSSSE